MKISQLKFDQNGLIPTIVQSNRDQRILMIAYSNTESLRLTFSSGHMHFYSRSRSEIWHKGKTSGNFLSVVELRADCDSDAVLAIVDEAGPACHTGERSCFDDHTPLELD